MFLKASRFPFSRRKIDLLVDIFVPLAYQKNYGWKNVSNALNVSDMYPLSIWTTKIFKGQNYSF